MQPAKRLTKATGHVHVVRAPTLRWSGGQNINITATSQTRDGSRISKLGRRSIPSVTT